MRLAVITSILAMTYGIAAYATPLSVGVPNTVKIKVDSSNSSKCNIEVFLPWKERIEVEVEPPALEATLQITPPTPGSFTIKWNGKTKLRGLKSVAACSGSGEVQLVAGHTAGTAKPLWDRFFSTLSNDQTECVRVGLEFSKIRIDSIDPNVQSIGPADPEAKQIFARCDSFFSARQAFIDRGWSDQKPFPCTVNNVRTSCEGGYAERMQDGKLRRITKNEAYRFHFENKPWTVSQREPAEMKDSRIAREEAARAEAERQREERRLAEEKAKRELEERRLAEEKAKRTLEARRLEEEKSRRDQEAKRLAEEKAKAAKPADPRPPQPIASTPASKNRELPMTKESCAKIDGYGEQDKFAIANSFGVSISSIKFLGAKWAYGRWGSQECLLEFDTAAGPKRCQITRILTDDNGKTAFAPIDPYKVGKAHNCY